MAPIAPHFFSETSQRMMHIFGVLTNSHDTAYNPFATGSQVSTIALSTGMDLATTVIVHYHEIALKGKNRPFFEQVLQNNLDRALAGIPHETPCRHRGRVEVPLREGACLSSVTERLSKVFGVTSFSFACKTSCDLTDLQEAAWSAVQQEEFETFRVLTRRADKRYPLTSMQVDAAVGGYVQDRCGARVDLSHPDLTCYIELLSTEGFVYTRKQPGPGGLPVGVGGRILCLISGGIDSPVAAYRLMRRGSPVSFVHFHGEPFTDRSSQAVVRELVLHLTKFQYRSNLYLVPFGDLQKAISLACDPAYRILLYRRLMVRIAEKIAAREKALALGTGESLGQVASQTLENLYSINAVATLPILRPLIGHDKQEIVDAALKIGTFEISTTPHVEDCCPLFMPDHPVTRSKLPAVEEVESNLDMESMVAQGVQMMQVERIDVPYLS